MNNIGKLTTFKRLLEEESVIMIPKVQRDYAYGRDEDKVREILDGMLTTMLDAVANDTVEIFDFVYGGTFVKRNNESSGLIPLDGQQRLTTLFLLHLYASIIQQDVDDKEVEPLMKFRYETRQSATNFIEALIGSIRDDIIAVYNDDKNIRSLIIDNPKYLPSYDSDPTIASMLNVLEKIEKKCRDYQIENLWTKLNTRDNIQFYSLSLDKFGLTDDLYIKMNSRGKKLTEFEIFKSDLEKTVNRISPNLKDQLSIKIDNSWMDILWSYAQINDGEFDLVKKADDGYMHLFKNVMRMELFRRGIEDQNNRQARIEEIITDETSIKSIISIFDVMSEIQKDGGLQTFWDSLFYFSNDMIGEESLIRLFWLQKQNQKPVYFLAMERDLSVPEMVYFYALFLIRSQGKSKETAIKCLRVVRNLITANVRANSAQYKMLAGFMADVKEIICNDGLLLEGSHTFLSTSCEEERYKMTSFSDDDYKKLLKYENHSVLQGSIMLFIDKYFDESNGTDELRNQLMHFEEIFNNECVDSFDKLRISFLDPQIEYMQYEPSMERETEMTRRFFIHRPSDFSQFFIKNERRRNQDAILDILANNLLKWNELKEPNSKCKEFGIDSWQYYMAKYKSSNIEGTTYGCYAWDDKQKRPLEIVILNSSYHSIYNIEWKMLNHILISELWDNNEKYSLDPHASSPFVMNKCGVTLTITQDGWLINCNENSIIQKIEDNGLYTVSPLQNEDTLYLCKFKDFSCGMDYIDLGKLIVSDIEDALS